MTDTAAPSQSSHAVAEIPFNLYKQAAPLTAKVLENVRLTKPDSPNEVCHLVFDISGSDYRYLDGQSAGILPPGTDATGKPHKLRLYSIASPSRGDDGKGQTFSLCVKRLVYNDPETGEERRGVCSNYICDLKPGDEVKVTGPTGKTFLLPAAPNCNLIMIATGTGIAPFRAFLKTRYEDRVQETGQSWLFFGAQYRSDYLYEEELQQFTQHDSFHLVTAFSREEKNAEGQRMYVQHRLYEHRDTLLRLLEQPNTYLYICGLRGMEPGILEALQQAAADKGISWDDLLARLNAEKRWHVEVY